MVVYCKMTPVAVTAVKVVCMEEQTAQVCVFSFYRRHGLQCSCPNT